MNNENKTNAESYPKLILSDPSQIVFEKFSINSDSEMGVNIIIYSRRGNDILNPFFMTSSQKRLVIDAVKRLLRVPLDESQGLDNQTENNQPSNNWE